MTSMIDGIRLEKMAKWYAARAEYRPEVHRDTCYGCGLPSGNTVCPDCLRLVADTLRDAAGRADK